MYKVKFCDIIMHMSIIYDSTEEKTELQKRIRAELEEKRQHEARKAIEQKNNGEVSAESNPIGRSVGVAIALVVIAALMILAALFVRR